MQLTDFDYALPPELIAREPARPRDASRLLVMDRHTGRCIDSTFRNLQDFLRPSDVLVLNDTRVVRARIRGALRRANGSTREIEVLFVSPAQEGNMWEVMCRPSRRIREGDRVVCSNGELEGRFGESRPFGLRLLACQPHTCSPESFLERHGHIPLPPYLQREDNPFDESDYQTVYANKLG